MKTYKDYLNSGQTKELPENVLLYDFFMRQAESISSLAMAQFITSSILDYKKNNVPASVIMKDLSRWTPGLENFTSNTFRFQTREGLLELAYKFLNAIFFVWPNVKITARDIVLILPKEMKLD